MRPVVAFLVALVLGACSPKGGAPPPVVASQKPKPAAPVEAKPAVPPRASNRAFAWYIQVRDASGKHDYGPEAEKEIIPIPSTSDWRCSQNGLKTSFSAEGDYYEIRDITCMLKSGHGVGGRTLCMREASSGKVTEDTQVLGLSEGSVEMKIVVQCEEDKTEQVSSPTPRVVPTPDPTPVDVIIVPPKTLSL